MDVSLLLTAAFRQAAALEVGLQEQWIALSHRWGSKLPGSLLSVSIQTLGELDMLVRAMESERTREDAKEPQDLARFSFHYQRLASELWVGSAYELVRLTNERALVTKSEHLAALGYDLRLLRIPMEKHEIAGDRKLKDKLSMERSPPNGDETDFYAYDKADRQKSHIMPAGVTGRGSMTWCAIDADTKAEKWIERLDLSERILSLSV